MATRLKTVEFPFATRTTSLNAATRHDFAAITVDIPETSSRVFRSVYVEITFCDHDATGGNHLTSRLIGIKLAAVAFSDSTISDVVFDTFARKHFKFTRDVTSYFTTNFGAGTSQTCQVGFQIGGVATQSISAKLIVTYEFSDTAQTTRVKTIKVPVQSNTGLLSATLSELGTNSVPKLTSSGLLPENTVSVKQMWFEFFAGEANTGGTDFNLAVSLDAEGEVSMGTLEMGTNCSTEYIVIWVRNDMDPTTTHALKARSSTANRLSNLGAILCVTYTYDHSATTTVLNSLELVVPNISSVVKSNDSSGDAYRSQLKFFIEEPGTITLKQSAIMMRGIFPSTFTFTPCALNLRGGSQSYTTYTYTPSDNTNPCGLAIFHRLDSGATAGAGITIARGENTFTFDMYNSTASVNSLDSVGGLLILNYTSDLATAGAETHNHTVKWCTGPTTAAVLYALETAAFAPNIPETDYYTTNIGYHLIKTQEQNSAQQLSIQKLSGEDSASGWYDVFLTNSTVNETYTTEHFVYTSQFFDRHPAEPDAKRLAIEGSRKYRMNGSWNATGGVGLFGLTMYHTYHCLTFVVSGYVSGYTGGGGGITVDVHRSDTNEWVGSATTSSGGGFSFTWYDDTISMYAQSYQDSNHRGRSNNAAAI